MNVILQGARPDTRRRSRRAFRNSPCRLFSAPGFAEHRRARRSEAADDLGHQADLLRARLAQVFDEIATVAARLGGQRSRLRSANLTRARRARLAAISDR